MCLFTTTQWGLIHLVPPLAGVSHRPRNSEFRSLPRSSTYSLLCSYWLLSSLLNQSESALSRDTFNSVQKDYPTAGFLPTLAASDTWISHCVVERHTAHRAHAMLCPCSEAGFQVLHRQAILVLPFVYLQFPLFSLMCILCWCFSFSSFSLFSPPYSQPLFAASLFFLESAGCYNNYVKVT